MRGTRHILRRFARRALTGVVALALVMLLYPALAYASWLWPANRGWRAPTAGPRIVVMTNGIHTGIAMPLRDQLWDWTPLLKLRATPGAWVWIGWGQRDFYLQTPRWADVRLRTVLAAAIGSERTLLHVDVMPPPIAGGGERVLTLSPAAYRLLATRMAASLASGARPIAGYRRGDFFYEARGRYSALHTCNAWTGETLRAAGVRIGRWTPTSGSVLFGLPATPPPSASPRRPSPPAAAAPAS